MTEENKELLSPNLLRRTYDSFAAGVAFISVLTKEGDESIGSCFHIGDGVFITARHVVENCTIKEIGTTVYQKRYFETEETQKTGAVRIELPYAPVTTKNYQGPFLHPDKNIDVAALVVPEINAPTLYLGDHLDDWLGQEYILEEVVVMGYPPIPFSREPLLIVSKCEVNAIVDKYTGGHPHFILSSMARGGFSGAPAITKDGVVLGVVTESLTSNYQPVELGYLSVMSVEGIYNCIAHHRIVPKHVDKIWDGFWNTESKSYSVPPFDHISIDIYRRDGEFYFKVFSDRINVLENALQIINNEFNSFYSLEWIHDKMFKTSFKNGSIDEAKANKIYEKLNELVKDYGIDD